MDNNEINPQLKKQLESLQKVPKRGLQASHASRENYLAQVKVLTPRAVQTSKPARGMGRRSWVSRFAAVAAVLLVALSTLGGTVYAAQASQPDDLLYDVKILTEEIQVSLESDPQQKLDLYVFFASRRLQEIQAQVEAGEEVSEKALTLLEKHTDKMLEQAARLDEKGLTNALLQIEQNLQKQNQLMAEMGKQHPQGNPPGLIKAQEKIRERLELVGNGINKPQGFRDTIRERKEKSENNDQGQGKDNGNGNSNKPDTPPGQDKNKDKGNGQGSDDLELEITPIGPGNGGPN
jgi:hypothetical protein